MSKDSLAEPPPGGGSRASNPGRVHLNTFALAACYPGKLLVPALLLLLGFALLIAALAVESLGVAAGIVLIAIGGAWLMAVNARMSMWLANGDTCPAVLLDPDSGLIAMGAEMSSTLAQSVPGVKVLRVPLRRATGAPFERGERLSVVCTFQSSGDPSQWSDVHPIPVVCATRNQATIRRSLESISDAQWVALENDMQQVDTSCPGLYLLAPRARDVQALVSEMADAIERDALRSEGDESEAAASGSSYASRLAAALAVSFLLFAVATVVFSHRMEKNATDGSIKAWGVSGLSLGAVLAVPVFGAAASFSLLSFPVEFFEHHPLGIKLVKFVGVSSPGGVKVVCIVAGLGFLAAAIGLYSVLSSMGP